jgi:hypothetical protein
VRIRVSIRGVMVPGVGVGELGVGHMGVLSGGLGGWRGWGERFGVGGGARGCVQGKMRCFDGKITFMQA